MKGENLETFERYLNQEMGDSEREKFELRLKQDAALREDLEEYKAILNAIGDKEVIDLRRQLKKLGEQMRDNDKRFRLKGPDKSWFWLAALLIVSLSIVSITYLWVNSPLGRQMFSARLGARNIQQQIYVLDPAYEELILYRVRSGDFHLEQPRDSLVVQHRAPIRFDWTTRVDGPVFLDILNNHGKKIFTTEKPVTSPFICRKNLPKGVYLYRFRTDTSTLHIGLFYIV